MTKARHVLRRGPLSRIVILSLAALAAAGCAKKETVVLIAVASPFTGDEGTEGRGLARAVDLAVEEANASGRFPFKLEMAPFDDRGDPGEAVKVAQLIVSDPRIAAVIGHRSSGCALPAAKVYARAGIPMISASATNPEVTRQQLKPDWPGPKVVFRVVTTDDIQASFAAKFIFQTLKKRKMSVMHDNQVYGRGLAEQFKKSWVELGGTIVSEDVLAPGKDDYRAQLGRAKAAGPDGLFFGGRFTEAGRLVRQMRELGMKTAFFSGDGAKTPSLFSVAGRAADGSYVTAVGVPVELLPRGQAFMAAYKKRWNGADEDIKPKDHFAYEAARIVFDALKEAGAGDKAKLLEALRKTSHQGLLGVTRFDENGDTLNKIVTMTRARFKDRSFEVLDLSEKKNL